MRIRKRFPPLISIPSAALSDPQAHRPRPLPVQVQHHQLQLHPDGNLPVQQFDTHSQQPSDPCTGAGAQENIKLNPKELEVEGDEDEKEVIKRNDTISRKESISGAEAGGSTSLPPLSTGSQLVLGGWFEGDKAIPFKKRRGSFGRSRLLSQDDEARTGENEREEKKIIAAGGKKMKSKTNKKSVQENSTADDQVVLVQETSFASDACQVKKNVNVKRGSVIMEGSRCSRVNGRGWRCCQQTLVGYSLCEHHLGKGRLRGMASVRKNPKNTAQQRKGDQIIIERLLPVRDEKEMIDEEMILLNVGNGGNTRDESDDDDDDQEDYTYEHHEDEDGKKKKKKKKRMKLGMVKARSISSLLGQTDNGVVVGDEDK